MIKAVRRRLDLMGPYPGDWQGSCEILWTTFYYGRARKEFLLSRSNRIRRAQGNELVDQCGFVWNVKKSIFCWNIRPALRGHSKPLNYSSQPSVKVTNHYRCRERTGNVAVRLNYPLPAIIFRLLSLPKSRTHVTSTDSCSKFLINLLCTYIRWWRSQLRRTQPVEIRAL